MSSMLTIMEEDWSLHHEIRDPVQVNNRIMSSSVSYASKSGAPKMLIYMDE